MLSLRNRVWRAAGVTLLGVGGLLAQSSSAEAGGFFHRMFYRQQCQQCYQAPVQAPVQAAPAAANAPAGSYQSNSFEPAATAAPAPAAVAPRYNSPSTSRSLHEQFRGDRKALGKY